MTAHPAFVPVAPHEREQHPLGARLRALQPTAHIAQRKVCELRWFSNQHLPITNQSPHDLYALKGPTTYTFGWRERPDFPAQPDGAIETDVVRMKRLTVIWLVIAALALSASATAGSGPITKQNGSSPAFTNVHLDLPDQRLRVLRQLWRERCRTRRSHGSDRRCSAKTRHLEPDNVVHQSSAGSPLPPLWQPLRPPAGPGQRQRLLLDCDGCCRTRRNSELRLPNDESDEPRLRPQRPVEPQ